MRAVSRPIAALLRQNQYPTPPLTETARLVRDWFFRNTDEDLLIATTQHANEASRRVLQQAGAVFAGTFEQYGFQQERYELLRNTAG
ncbi:GNAT family N-acetyltransferase [Actinoplanes sp. HUAS TT8]|uniref:GNAT family N-acetyltransferase n=1 Tax=Actinoplanes sp. HUAS TT8 TaxID=3447453 RepID=UPI003F51C122